LLYFFSFILLSALILVSVFVGIIVTGMQDATEQVGPSLFAPSVSGRIHRLLFLTVSP